MRYGDLTYQEIRQRAQMGWLAVVPTGCTEQQGPHLTVDFDTWLAETVCLAAADLAAKEHNVHALVLPAMPFGPTMEHRNYGAGYVNLSQAVFEGIVASTLDSLFEQGFRRLVVWRGCVGHDLNDVMGRFNAAYPGLARAILPDSPYEAIWRMLGDRNVPGGHADSLATSLALHLRPESVRKELIADPESTPVDWNAPFLDFTRHSSTGVIGDPTHASAELGEKLWEAIVEDVAWTYEMAAKAPLK